MNPLWVVGDVHGAYDKLRSLLERAGLIDFDGGWTGGDTHLVFLGDYLDRGPQGLEVIRLVRSLEVQAPEAGGQVTALIGNHEVMFLAAQVFREQDPHDRLGFRQYWLENGGQPRDAELLDPSDLAWLLDRPVMAASHGWLLVHADNQMYLRLGESVSEVNAEARRILATPDADHWGLFMNWFTERMAFVSRGGEARARRTLETFGGEHLAHGHTPVYILRDEVMHGPSVGPGLPVAYAGRRCVALDSGMAYREDAGFIARLNRQGAAQVVTVSNGDHT